MLNRRTFITTAPITAAAICAGQMLEAQKVTPVMALYREWAALDATLCGQAARSLTDAEFDRRIERLNDIANRMMATPSEDVGDALAKVAAQSGYGEFGNPSAEDNPEFWSEVRHFLT